MCKPFVRSGRSQERCCSAFNPFMKPGRGDFRYPVTQVQISLPPTLPSLSPLVTIPTMCKFSFRCFESSFSFNPTSNHRRRVSLTYFFR